MVRRLFALLLLLVAGAARAGAPIAAITPANLRAHIEVLAGDAFAGRAPGTEGGRKTEAYIVGQFRAAGLSPAAPGGGWLQPVDVRGIAANNVVGRIAGRDPARGAALLTAHWDHLGRCRELAMDRICNGAIDNASGVAALIEIARALAAGPQPVRDVIVVATTGEEKGELGAKQIVARPPVPLAGVVAAFNLDTIAIAPRGAPVAMIGRGRTALDPLIFAVAKAEGRRVDSDDEGNQLLARQDGWPLLQAGVPAVMVGGAFSDMRLLGAFLAGRYHTPQDDLRHPIELGGAAEDADLHVALIRAFADPSRYPAKQGGATR